VNWLAVDLDVDAGVMTEVEEILARLGVESVTVEDAGDQALLEPGPGEQPLWSAMRMRALFADVDPGSLRQRLDATGLGDRVTRIEPLAERDWTRAWMDRYEPMQFGTRLMICPTHREPPTDSEAIVIRLDPGLAFGSGTHPTTALCLEWIGAQDLDGAVAVDYGCGCGVLAIAMALCGARRVYCVDHDDQALQATRDNAERNGVGDLLLTLSPEQPVPERCDVILANILAGPLVSLAPALRALARPRGRIVLAGLLDQQADTVAAAYARWAGLTDRTSREGWTRLELSVAT